MKYIEFSKKYYYFFRILILDHFISLFLNFFKKNGVFVYMEDRCLAEKDLNKLQTLFSSSSEDCMSNFSNSLLISKFVKEDKTLIQRVFTNKIYGIVSK
jgi:hypothetical protein